MSDEPAFTVPRLVVDNRAGGVISQGAPALPIDCPVRPLGKKGAICFYLDALNQLVELPVKEHTRVNIEGLFGPKVGLLLTEAYWPRKKKGEDGSWYIDSWHPERGARAFLQSAAQMGLWEPLGHVRGPGAWCDDGVLILNCGDAVLVGDRWHSPGKIGSHVYPAHAKTLRPADEFIAEGPANPALELLEIYRTWAWKRGELDSRLLLGWQAAALLGGAIPFRPVVWISGREGTGKTTLMDCFKSQFGDMLIQSADPSPAYLWQKCKHASVPILVDEQEPDTGGRNAGRQIGLIKLARIAATGSSLGRGGSDHEPEEFVARSCFMLSSILVPSLSNQDKSRMAILELLPLKGTAPDLNQKRMTRLAAALYRRLVDNWPRFEKTLEILRASLRAEGHSARGADVFGTLLACLDLALHDHQMDSETAAQWAMELHASHLAETAEQISGEEQVLQFLLSTLLPRNAPNSRACGELVRDAGSSEWQEHGLRANEILMNYGMKVEWEKGKETMFAVANHHAELYRLFQGTQWETPAGLTGIWVQALRRLPDARPGQIRLAGGPVRATLIPIHQVVDSKAAPRRGADEEEKK